MRLHGYRQQRTLARSVSLDGVGLITGKKVQIRFCPTAEDTGLVFQRTDLPATKPIAALADHVTGTQRRTTLGPTNQAVTLVEHVLASLSGLRIDNCRIELDGPEPPGLDGSAKAFTDRLIAAGMVLQQARKPIYAVSQSMIVNTATATLAIHPPITNELQISYILDYGSPSYIPPQVHTETITPHTLAQHLAPCRTFILESEAAELQKQGIGRHLNASGLLVFGRQGVLDNQLHFANEPARHKILDLVGDLALCGYDLIGHVVAYRSGHPLNVELAKTLRTRIHAQNKQPVARMAA